VKRLEEEVSHLSENQVKNEEKQLRMKEENAHMVERSVKVKAMAISRSKSFYEFIIYILLYMITNS
jgi:hypothetical protein